MIPYPPYSPDLAPCDFWLNDYIKRQLAEIPSKKSEGTLFNAVVDVLNNIPKEEYRKTFRKLAERWQMCIYSKGDYFEHSTV